MNVDFIKEMSFVFIDTNIWFFADLADYVLDEGVNHYLFFIWIIYLSPIPLVLCHKGFLFSAMHKKIFK